MRMPSWHALSRNAGSLRLHLGDYHAWLPVQVQMVLHQESLISWHHSEQQIACQSDPVSSLSTSLSSCELKFNRRPFRPAQAVWNPAFKHPLFYLLLAAMRRSRLGSLLEQKRRSCDAPLSKRPHDITHSCLPFVHAACCFVNMLPPRFLPAEDSHTVSAQVLVSAPMPDLQHRQRQLSYRIAWAKPISGAKWTATWVLDVAALPGRRLPCMLMWASFWSVSVLIAQKPQPSTAATCESLRIFKLLIQSGAQLSINLWALVHQQLTSWQA